MSLCPYAYLRVSLSGLLTASDQGSLTTPGELSNISALDPLLPTLLIATLCLCALLTIFYYSLVVAWEVLWASRRSPSPLDPSAEVVLTGGYVPFWIQLHGDSLKLTHIQLYGESSGVWAPVQIPGPPKMKLAHVSHQTEQCNRSRRLPPHHPRFVF